jgi:hypothetical protein
MNISVQTFLIIYSLGLFLSVWVLSKRGLLRPAYALLWLLTGFSFIIISIFRNVVPLLADFFQVSYPPTLMIAAAICFLTVLLLHHTVLLSLISNKNKELSQDYAILKWRMEQLEKAQDQLSGKNPDAPSKGEFGSGLK